MEDCMKQWKLYNSSLKFKFSDYFWSWLRLEKLLFKQITIIETTAVIIKKTNKAYVYVLYKL